jgi:hypothetical protein
MSLNLLVKFGAQSGVTDFSTEFWNAFVEEIALALTALQDKSASFDEARAQLIEAALFRLNEILLPAFETVQEYQQGGFLVAPIVDDSEVTFAEGPTTLGIHPDHRAMFRPTPYVAMVRESTYTDVAIARTVDYDTETGALSIDIVAVIGEAGPWSDVIVSATSGSVMAQNQFLTEAQSARDKAEDWAEKAVDSPVETGKYSAKHHATKAAASASAAEGFKNTASSAAGAASSAATAAGTARDKAEQWADEDEDVEVDDGKYSAKHYAAKSAASAEAAATFDPSSYYTKAQTYTQAEVAAAISAAIDGVINGAPGALDTLYEIAASLGDDPDLKGTLLAAIAAKADAVHTHTLSQISDASANGRSLVSAANYAAMRTLLGLVIGTNVQAYDADTAKTDAEQTWTGAQLFGQIGTTVSALGSGSTINCSANNAFSRTISGNVTFSFSNVPSSRSFGVSLVLTYSSGTVTWPSAIKWKDDTAPSFTGGKTYEVVLHTIDGGSTWRGAALEYAG